MRIAISGTHRAGKSTLASALANALPKYEAVDEAYYLLEEDGFEFADPPSIEDFERQLERSIECIEQSAANTLFDRCPADYLGYLLTHPDADLFELADWLPRIQAAVEKLDLIVFVSIEEPDRIRIPRSEMTESRADVDAVLKQIVLEDSYGMNVEVVLVTGPTTARLQQVIARIREASV